MTPLAAKLAERIKVDGPITIADYMSACLGDPDHGYYSTHEPFGREGDFVTSPEVSQIFGELIGAWAVATWEAMGSPPRFMFAELGPGRGTLMADMLRTAKIRPAFGAALEVHLLETSQLLRDLQRKTLAGSAAPLTWHDRIDSLPELPAIVIANEFFDALPIRQFVRRSEGWAERMVGLDAQDMLAFGLRPAAPPTSEDPPEGSVLEISQSAMAIAAMLTERLKGKGGAALLIDYGHDTPGFGDTLQSVRRHKFDDVLAAPGEADLTAHVDFSAISSAAAAAGASVRPLMSQGEFLIRLGLSTRASALAKGKDERARRDIEKAATRLAGPQAMGKLFKVLAISAPGLKLPAFD